MKNAPSQPWLNGTFAVGAIFLIGIVVFFWPGFLFEHCNFVAHDPAYPAINGLVKELVQECSGPLVKINDSVLSKAKFFFMYIWPLIGISLIIIGSAMHIKYDPTALARD